MRHSLVANLLASAALTLSLSCVTSETNSSRDVAGKKDDGDAADTLAQLDMSRFPRPTWVTVGFSELSKYNTLYAMSDIHGQLDEAINVLWNAGLTDREGNWSKKDVLLIFVGDYIDKSGPKSAETLLFVKKLQSDAKQTAGRVIALLGNHEARYLGDPTKCEKDTLASASNVDPKVKKCEDILNTEFGKYMQGLPLGAIAGNWMFVHSGFIDSKPDPKSLDALFKGIDKSYTGKKFSDFDDEKHSVVAAHDWVQNHHSDERLALHALGLSGIVVGHEASILGSSGSDAEICMNKNGWITKIDVGMNKEASTCKGKLLECPISKILKGKNLEMANDGTPNCDAINHDGNKRDIQVTHFHD